MQRLAGSRKNAQAFRLQPFHLRESFDEFFLEPVGIAAALRGHFHDGLLRSVARPEGVFIRIDHHRSGMKSLAVLRGERRFGSDTESHRSRGRGRQLQKRPSRTVGKNLVGFHAGLLIGTNICVE